MEKSVKTVKKLFIYTKIDYLSMYAKDLQIIF